MRFDEDETPLHSAVITGSVEIVQILLDRFAELNSQDIEGKTPLILAIENKYNEMAEVLIANGANVNAMGCGYAPIHKAVDQSTYKRT